MYKILSALCVLVVLLGGCAGKYNTKEKLYAEGMKQLSAQNPGNAIIFFKNALEKDQNYFDARFQLAKTYFSVGKLDSAEKELQKASRQRPGSMEVRIELAKVHVHMSKADEALSEIGDYVTAECNEPVILETAGMARSLKGDYGAAVGLLKRSIAADSGRPTAVLALAQVYLLSGDDREAETLLTEILKKDSSNNDALRMLAELKIKENDISAASEAYDRILRNDPADGRAFYRRGIIFVKGQDYASAMSLSESFIGRFPRKAEGHLLKGITLFHKKNLKEAIVALQKSISLQPSIPGHYFLGLCHYYADEPEQSMTQMQKVLEINPSFFRAREVRSLILLKKNRPDDAIQEMKKVVEHNDGDALAYSILGSAYMSKAMYADGMENLNRALEIDPALVDVRIKKGLFELATGLDGAAETELSTAVRINPDMLDTRLLLASYYMKRNDYGRAMQTLSQGIKKQKADAVLYTLMADISLRQKNMSEAEERLSKAKAADPAYDASYMKLAAIYYYRSELDKSIQELESLLKTTPGHVRGLLTLAGIYESTGRDGDAVKQLRRAAETGKVEGSIGMAAYYLRKKEEDKALSVLDEAIRKNPNEGSLLELKGKTLVARKKFSDAIATFENLEKINARAGLAYLVNTYNLMGKPEQALEKVRKEIKRSPEQLDLAAEASRILAGMGKRQEAIDIAERIIQSRPESPVGYMALALIYEEGGELDKGIDVLTGASRVRDADLLIMLGNFQVLKRDHDGALRSYREAEALKPGYVPALAQKGALLHSMGRKNEAIAQYQKILRLSQNSVLALNNISYLYAEDDRDLHLALQYASRAHMLAPGEGSVQDTLGYILFKNKKYTEAEKVLKQAVETMPGNASVHYHLALVYKELKNNAQALEQIQKAVSTADFPEAAHAKILLAQLSGAKAQGSK